MNDLAAPGPHPLVTAPILPTLLRLTLPNLGAMLASTLVAVAETSYVGALGTAPLAGMALVFPLIMLMQMLSAGAMGGGVSSAISRALGAGDRVRAERLAFHAAAIGVVAGLCFSLFFFTSAGPILRLLGGRGEVLEEALRYANVALSGTILIWLVNTLASIVRGTGNMRVPSLTLLAAATLQVGLGGALGLGLGPIPRLGLTGVAFGIVVASAAGSGFLLWFLMSGHARVRLRAAGRRFERAMFVDILRVGAVSALGPLQVVLIMLILTALVARFGDEALAGYGIGTRLEFLLIPIAFAVGVASVPLVGMAMGAGLVARARRVAWTSAALSVTALAAIGLAVAVAPELWSALFTDDAGVQAAANLYLRFAGPGFAFIGLALSLYFASQGAGHVLPPILAGIVRLVVIVIGGFIIVATDAPAPALFAVIGLSMVAFGASVAAAVYLTPWGPKDPAPLLP